MGKIYISSYIVGSSVGCAKLILPLYILIQSYRSTNKMEIIGFEEITFISLLFLQNLFHFLFYMQ